ncbi:1-deoxy-D-xylulose-5-phosphate synthase N-terminal domain-containing protein [Pantoea ananatis]
MVELTVALHYVYNTPFDHLVWDVRSSGLSAQNFNGTPRSHWLYSPKNGVHPFPWRRE